MIESRPENGSAVSITGFLIFFSYGSRIAVLIKFLGVFNLKKIHLIHHGSNHIKPCFAWLNLHVAVHGPCLSLVTSNSCHWQISHCTA